MNRSNLKNAKIVFVGCVEAGFFAADRMIEAGIRPKAVVSLDRRAARRHRVSGYRDLFDLKVDCERRRPKTYALTSVGDVRFFVERRFDILIVLGWQRLIPRPIIESLGVCGMTIHGSSRGLPKGRGRSPMNWAILEGAGQFRLSLLTMSPEADGGDIVETLPFDILPGDDIRTLYYKNALAASRLLVKNVPLLMSGRKRGTPQDDRKATYYPRRTPEDGRIDWRKGAAGIARLIRATTRPYPGAFTFNRSEKITVWEGRVFDKRLTGDERPGVVAAVFSDGAFLAGTADYYFLVDRYAGKTPAKGDMLK